MGSRQHQQCGSAWAIPEGLHYQDLYVICNGSASSSSMVPPNKCVPCHVETHFPNRIFFFSKWVYIPLYFCCVLCVCIMTFPSSFSWKTFYLSFKIHLDIFSDDIQLILHQFHHCSPIFLCLPSNIFEEHLILKCRFVVY